MQNWRVLAYSLSVVSSLTASTFAQAQTVTEPTQEANEAPPEITIELATDESERVREEPLYNKSLIDRRAAQEQSVADNPFVITPHRTNYVLPAKYSSRMNEAPYADIEDVETLDPTEIKYQFSFKFPLALELFGSRHSLWAAYTQQSFWQSYNTAASRPFRETNYEPEVFVSFALDGNIFGVKPKLINIGLNHQSNGRNDPVSRSWNRLFAQAIFEYDNLALSWRAWYRIPEPADDDDNPDINEYLGYGELSAVYVDGPYTYDIMWRNNLDVNNNRGAFQVGMTFPLWNRFRGYIQYFNGYGESLIDYDHHTQSLGIGIMLTNWL